MLKKFPLLFIFALVLTFLCPHLTHAQEAALQLRLTKVAGYNGFDGKIQGTFKLKAQGPDTLESVTFYFDGEQIGTVEQAPFELQFSTGDYATGIHTFSARGILSDGQSLRSQEVGAEIITAAQARRAALNLVLPILLLSFGAVLVSALFPLLASRKSGTRPVGSYGAAGGTVCPKCGLPFSRHFLTLNVITGKLERCPHCGKWSIVPRAAAADLMAAEDRLNAEMKSTQAQKPENIQEQLHKRLENTRFED